ncbi:MAG TPA: DUF2069 domain-containing protein [Gammaproteobacteria bacterium]|jgi:hypothetical protein|nr:DUF2069 domain-containing protein [Gammaproteobacteria bacterium]
MTRSTLGRAVLACHVALALLIAAAVASGGVTPPRLGLLAFVLAPLLATLYGLVTQRRGTERWLAVLLVPYAGALSVEVVARSGAAPSLSAALLICVLELGLLLALIRARGARG